MDQFAIPARMAAPPWCAATGHIGVAGRVTTGVATPATGTFDA